MADDHGGGPPESLTRAASPLLPTPTRRFLEALKVAVPQPGGRIRAEL
jgi:hypothetical protein